MKTIFTWIQQTFSLKERWVLGISTVISGLILSSLFWLTPVEQGVNPYQLLAYNIDVFDRDNTKLDPFYTIFFANYEAKAPDEEKVGVTSFLEASVPMLHRYADRHHEFVDDQNQLVINLKMLNESLGSDQWLTIDAVFYDLLHEAKAMTLFTGGAFNMFIGAVSDYWDALLDDPLYRFQYREKDPAYQPLARRALETLLSYVPLAPIDIEATLSLREVAGQCQVKFNPFNGAQVGELKITLGAIAKGFANDIMADGLADLGYTRGYISNGTSSITTMGPRYGNTAYRWQVTSPHPSANLAFTIEKPGRHSLSTSGAYNGFYIPIGNTRVLRHHIIDPHTGYPANQAIELNVISSTYPAARLDALSTAMMTMTKENAMSLRQTIMNQGFDLEMAWIEVINNQVAVAYSEGYQTLMQREANVKYTRL